MSKFTYQEQMAILEKAYVSVADIILQSVEGDVVLDPFMGSGTTAVACIKTNRKYIGFELDKHYCEIANERIQKALADSDEKGL
jgi:DNA modification methylase